MQLGSFCNQTIAKSYRRLNVIMPHLCVCVCVNTVERPVELTVVYI